MTKKEWEELTLDEAIEWAYHEYGVYELTSEDVLICFAKEKIDEDNIGLALHILGAVYNSEEAYNGYYLYDYSLGTISTPTPITRKEDLEDYITFEEDEEDEEAEADVDFLPESVAINKSDLDSDWETFADDEKEEVINNYLSDTYGFLIYNYNYQETADTVVITDILWDIESED